MPNGRFEGAKDQAEWKIRARERLGRMKDQRVKDQAEWNIWTRERLGQMEDLSSWKTRLNERSEHTEDHAK